MGLKPDHLYDHIPFCGNFRWKEALYLPQWETHCFPDYEQYRNVLKTAEIMEEIRKKLGNRPIKITSWVRPKQYNEKIGGAWLSGHIYGMAVDFVHSEMDSDQVRERLRGHLDTLNIRMEDLDGASWVHIDIKKPMDGKRYFKP